MSKEKLTKRQAQANKTRDRIHKIAVDLMEKKGFSNVTISDISKKARVSIGAFYHYYKSKEDIFFEIYKRGDEYFRDQVKGIIDASGLDSAGRIVLFFRHYAIFNQQRGLENVNQLYNSKNKFFIAKGRYMQVLLGEIISKGQEDNEITRSKTPDYIDNYLFVAARGIIYDWCLHEGDYDLEQYMVEYMEQLVKIFKR